VPVEGERAPGAGSSGAAGWTFLTNHAHVLVCLARAPGLRLREVAQAVGITERAVQRIVADLQRGGYVARERRGRRNGYEVRRDLPLRHALEAHRTIGDLLLLLAPAPAPAAGPDADTGGDGKVECS
jgi:DNA-binding IscR family transcriptional regulator